MQFTSSTSISKDCVDKYWTIHMEPSSIEPIELVFLMEMSAN
jgi:hypothetical protein